MEITTRQAVSNDAAAIALAHMRAWQVAYQGIVPADVLAAIDLDARTTRWRQNLTETALPDGTPAPRHRVAEADGLVVGFACVGVWREVPTDASLAELWAMYVHPDSWGSGAGYALMGDVVADFRSIGVEAAYLWVLEQNTMARTFYERQGWRADEVLKQSEIGGAEITEARYSLRLS